MQDEPYKRCLTCGVLKPASCFHQRGGGRRRPRCAACSGYVQAVPIVTSPEVPDDFGNWLAGFIDGEGCFVIDPAPRRPPYQRSYTCRFRIGLRDDDTAILDRIAATTGLGGVRRFRRESRSRGDKPGVIWTVDGRDECLRLAFLLDTYPLRSKKARDLVLWRQAAIAWKSARRGWGTAAANRPIWASMAALRRELMEGRAYHSPAPLAEK